MCAPDRPEKRAGNGAPRHRRGTADWTPEDAPRLAREAGLESLGDHHWKVITSCREEAARTGRIPGLRRLAVLTGFDVPELHRLFTGDAEAIVSRIAGLRSRPAGHDARDGRESAEG